MYNSVIAALLSSLMAFLINRLILKFLRKNAALWLVPALEESVKTLSCIALGGSIVATHAIFGIIEGLWDIKSSSSVGVKAALVSIGGHVVFGVVTWLIWDVTNYVLFGMFVAGIVHTAWNYVVLSGLMKGNN